MDVASKNLDSNDRYSYEGQSEDMHTWFFLYDEKLAVKHDTEPQKQVSMQKTLELKITIQSFQVNNKDLCSSTSVPNLEIERSEY